MSESQCFLLSSLRWVITNREAKLGLTPGAPVVLLQQFLGLNQRAPTRPAEEALKEYLSSDWQAGSGLFVTLPETFTNHGCYGNKAIDISFRRRRRFERCF